MLNAMLQQRVVNPKNTVYSRNMIPLLRLKAVLASPLVFLAVLGGTIVAADLWMRRQPLPPSRSPQKRPARSTPRRRISTSRRRPAAVAGAI